MTFPFPAICPGNSKPGPFSFSNVVNASASTLYTSNTITPTGYDSPALVTVSGGEYRINGGTWTSLSTYISPGQTIQVRATSSPAWGTSKTVSISIDTTSTTWGITTATVTGGAWDTGWTTGSWTFTTPAAFNWVRVQMWAPGGGGGGGAAQVGTDDAYSNAGNGGAAGIAQFAGGPYATGGGGGTGGGIGTYASGPNGSPGGHGTGYGGDTNTYAGGAAGGGGGAGYAHGQYFGGGNGGAGGTGGYFLKTYNWGSLAPSTGYPVVVQGRGGGGAGGYNSTAPWLSGAAGGAGNYGRCYIDWG